ncbi:MAG: hypothetical protein LQ346_004273 [Caloplaca aetnensis]|nr:MAG: hypothetical protein LQ346_004273 [Caloplaca aetnensis]
MPAPSLSELTRRALTKNIANVTDIGDIPYQIIRPVLLKIENPNQLQMLEERSPQLYGADAEIWVSLIKRDIPDGDKKLLYPKNPENWWKVYRKMRNDYEKVVQNDAAKLKAAFTGIQSAKDSRQIRIMEGIPKIPKLDGMQFAHAAEYNRIKKPPKLVKPPTSVIRFTGGSKTKTLTGKGVMDKARREAQEMSRFRKTNVMATPTHMLSGLSRFVPPTPPKDNFETPTRINRPPPPKKHVEFFMPGPRKPPVGSAEAERIATAAKVEERERRLSTLINPRIAYNLPTTTIAANPPSAIATTPRLSARHPAVSAAAATPRKTTTPATPAPAPDRLRTAPSSILQSKSDMKNKALPTIPSTATPRGSKRKAEDLPMQSIEVDEPTSTFGPTKTTPATPNQAKATPSPPRHKIPRLSGSPSTSGVRTPTKKVPVSIFMPARHRRPA